MVALDRWGALLNTPKTLACRRRELIGRDGAAPIVVGTGEVEMPSPTDFAITLTGTRAEAMKTQGSPHEEFGQRFYSEISLVRVRTVEFGRPRSNAARRSRAPPARLCCGAEAAAAERIGTGDVVRERRAALKGCERTNDRLR